MKKLLSTLSLTLLTTTSVVGMTQEVKASEVQASSGAIHQMYNHYGIDKGHWDLLVAVAQKGVRVYFGGEHCTEETDDQGVTWTTMGYYWSVKKQMVFCPSIQGKAALQSTIRHEVGHMVQDLKDRRLGDGYLTPWFNTKDGEFWSYYQKNGRINHEYVESYRKNGDQENYHLEADAEVQQTETAETLRARLFQF